MITSVTLANIVYLCRVLYSCLCWETENSNKSEDQMRALRRVFQDCWNLSLSPSTLVTSCRHRDPLKMLKVAAGKSCLKLINRMIDSCWSTTFASLVQKWDSSTDRAPFEPWQLPDLRRGSLFLHHILAKGIHSSNCVLQRPPCLQCIQSLQQRIFFKVKILFSGFQS